MVPPDQETNEDMRGKKNERVRGGKDAREMESNHITARVVVGSAGGEGVICWRSVVLCRTYSSPIHACAPLLPSSSALVARVACIKASFSNRICLPQLRGEWVRGDASACIEVDYHISEKYISQQKRIKRALTK
eukprot:gene8802-6188_t